MKHWHMWRITTADAEREPEGQRLFGSAYDARQAMLRDRAQRATLREAALWQKPRVDRKGARPSLEEVS